MELTLCLLEMRYHWLEVEGAQPASTRNPAGARLAG